MEQNDISSRIVFADRGKVNVEKGVEFAPKFDQNGLIPALAMDHITHEPLMLAYMNAESLRMTMELGEAVYYSRSRQEIWHTGATSGHVQKVKQIGNNQNPQSNKEFYLNICVRSLVLQKDVLLINKKQFQY